MKKYWRQIVCVVVLFIIMGLITSLLIGSVKWLPLLKSLMWPAIMATALTLLVWGLKNQSRLPAWLPPRYIWGTIGAVGSILAIFFGIRMVYESIQANKVVREAQVAEARVETCRQNPFAQGCFPADTTIAHVIYQGDTVPVPVPPYYSIDWYGECDEFDTSRKRDGVMLWRLFTTKEGVDSTTVTSRVYLPPANSPSRREDTCKKTSA